jgi:sodium/potassium-transporting ATPase subunit alpha
VDASSDAPPEIIKIDTIAVVKDAGAASTAITAGVENAGHGANPAVLISRGRPAWTKDPSLPIVVNGHTEVEALTEEDWDTVVSRTGGAVFARMTPEDKHTLVMACKARGAVITVTGDGVNDAPALRAAHVGVAMGQGGSDVAREAADVVLMDNSFASLVEGIRQGRRIFDNLKKTIAYTLTHLVPEIIPVLAALALGIPAGLSSIAVLSIDLMTELAPAISLAYERAEGDVMARPPRNLRTDRLVTKPLLLYSYVIAGLIEAMTCLSAFLLVFHVDGVSVDELLHADTSELFVKDAAVLCPKSGSPCIDAEEQVSLLGRASAAYYINLVLMQVGFHMWVCKTLREPITRSDKRNLMSYYGAALSISFMIILSFVPGVMDVMGFGKDPTEPIICAPAAIGGLTLVLVAEGRKYLVRVSPKWRRYLAW